MDWATPYGEFLHDPDAMKVTWGLIHRLFHLPDPRQFQQVVTPDDMDPDALWRCRSFLEACSDYAELSFHGSGAFVQVRSVKGEVTVESEVPTREQLRAAAATFRLLWAQRESCSYPHIQSLVGRLLVRSGDHQQIAAHKEWTDVHKKHLTRMPIRRIAELEYSRRHGGTGSSLPPVESPAVLIDRYLYGGQLHIDADKVADLPPKDDPLRHSLGLLGFLAAMDQLGAFYLGYGVIVAQVTGLDLRGQGRRLGQPAPAT